MRCSCPLLHAPLQLLLSLTAQRILVWAAKLFWRQLGKNKGLSGLNELHEGSWDTTTEHATVRTLGLARPLLLWGQLECISVCIIKPWHTVFMLNCCHLHPKGTGLSNFQFLCAVGRTWFFPVTRGKRIGCAALARIAQRTCIFVTCDMCWGLGQQVPNQEHSTEK